MNACLVGKESVITTSQLPEGMGTVQQIERMEDIVSRQEQINLIILYKIWITVKNYIYI